MSSRRLQHPNEDILQHLSQAVRHRTQPHEWAVVRTLKHSHARTHPWNVPALKELRASNPWRGDEAESATSRLQS
eukprot:14888632-Alexandrium_andersonii.AAC.1